MFIQYVPMVRRSFWQALDPTTRTVFAQTWREAMMSARAFASERQDKARISVREHGVRIVTPDRQALARERDRLRQLQDAMVSELKVPRELVTLVDAAIQAALADPHD